VPQYLLGKTYLTFNGALEAMKVARATMTANERQDEVQPYVSAAYTIIDAFNNIEKGGCLKKAAAEQYAGDDVNGRVTDFMADKDDNQSHFEEIDAEIDIPMSTVKTGMKPSFVSRFLGVFN
jgi:hypothetical protein